MSMCKNNWDFINFHYKKGRVGLRPDKETEYYCVFGSVIKMVPKVENFGFLIIFWFVRKKIFRPKFALFWKFCFWFFGKSLKLFQKNFSRKESLDQDLDFGFCFIKIGRLESTFWGGVPLLGGVCGPAMKKFPKSNFNWNSSDFYTFCRVHPNRRDGTPPHPPPHKSVQNSSEL